MLHKWSEYSKYILPCHIWNEIDLKLQELLKTTNNETDLKLQELLKTTEVTKTTWMSWVTGVTKADGSVSLVSFNMTWRFVHSTRVLKAWRSSVWHLSNSDLKQKCVSWVI